MSTLKKITINLYVLSERVIFYSRHQNYSRATKYLKQWISAFSSFIKCITDSDENVNIDISSVSQMLSSILEAQKSGDYILIADYLENNSASLISGVLSCTDAETATCSSNGRTYILEESFYGLKTVKVEEEKKEYYLHSISNPVREALTLTDNYFDADCEGYVIFGLGLGYFPAELYLRCNKSVPVKVFECDRTIYDAYVKEGYFSDISDDNFTVTFDPELEKFVEAIENNPGYAMVIHAPSVNLISNSSVRARLNELFIHDSSIRDQKCQMNSNFRNNIQICHHYVDELKASFDGKDVYLIAAGPSLDKNITLLKQKPQNSVILAVGAVYRKLISIGIQPDYVVFLDSSELIYPQIDSLLNETVPLIICSTAYYKISSEYRGDKYLVCQKDFLKAEEYAEAHSHNTYKTGGSVSTIAFDIAVKLGAKRVITLGLDLSYTNSGKIHADDAGIQEIPLINSENGVLSIDGYYGETVLTTPSFELYRQWFINYISDLKQSTNDTPEFINATEGGCFINGMNHISLESAICF